MMARPESLRDGIGTRETGERVERRRLVVRGTVQGVGFRPFVYRLARDLALAGWVRNDGDGVTVDVSGDAEALDRFVAGLYHEAPPAARVEAVEVLERAAATAGGMGFVIVASDDTAGVTTAISPDLPVCGDCLRELRDPTDRRHGYPFINCTNCGPRYSIVLGLPYDRPLTTMRAFDMCDDCRREYHDPLDRRFHAQPTACPRCGPGISYLASPERPGAADGGDARGAAAVHAAVACLTAGGVLALKGIGGYHLACDATQGAAVRALRERKFRKEKPFALMGRDLGALASVVDLTPAARALLTGSERPIVLLPKRGSEHPAADLAPDNADLGVMLPYTPLHHLLFDAGAPPLLVMTSANRSAEPIVYRDDEALERLGGLADAFLMGERPIARRVDDSVAQVVAGKASVTRRARGYAPAPVMRSPRFGAPIMALGAELKSSLTLVVGGAAYVSQHLGDLTDLDAFTAFQETVFDLCAMYRVDALSVPMVHDAHPGYASTRFARERGGPLQAVQHHAAHVASVLAERNAWTTTVLGIAFDGAGLGDDGTVWGGEVFHGSLATGLRRVAHLRPAYLPGGDAAARTPVQAAAGWLEALGDDVWDRVTKPPFSLPAARLDVARQLVASGVRAPRTTSAGRLFDTVAALLGFHRTMTFEGQAAIWLEALARQAPRGAVDAYPWPFDGRSWDHGPLLAALLDDRTGGTPPALVAARFHETLAQGVVAAAVALRGAHPFEHVVISGGVFQNGSLVARLTEAAASAGLDLWRNEVVPANDGGVSLGQAALAAAGHG